MSNADRTPPATAPLPDARPGLVAALVVLCLYGGLALSVDFPRVAQGFTSDEATYYMLAHSLARDGDLTYRRQDLERVWHEFPAGPTGVFLKRGSSVAIAVDGTFPFLHVRLGPDRDQSRLFFGKSFAYPLFAAPWVVLFGTGGLLLFHALLLSAVTFAGYLFLNARARPGVALLLVSAFVFASVVSAYLVWTTPELFNFAFVFLGYFCWLYKEVAQPDAVPRPLRWLLGPGSDVAAAVLIGVATFSKPPNALLVLPILAWQLRRRHAARAALTGLVFGVVVAALFGVNVLTSGEWNYQGGARSVFYTAFPFLPGGAAFDVGMDRATNRLLTEVIFDPRVFWTVLEHNLVYFVVGRHSGLLPYFFPGLFALGAFLVTRGRRAWQVLVLGVALAEILILIIWIPYDYFGGGGVLGNRYFMNWYGLFFFLYPAIDSVALALVPWAVGALFTAQITLNPFYAAFHPAEPAMHGPLRWLPVELTLVNNLPVTIHEDRVRVPFGPPERPFQMYFLDANALLPAPESDRPLDEAGSFWVRGESEADCLLRSVTPMKRVVVTLTGGDVPDRVTVKAGGARRTVDLEPGGVTYLTLPLGPGFPYKGSSYVWTFSVSSRSGFVPMFTRGGVDSRFLGVRVRPALLPQ